MFKFDLSNITKNTWLLSTISLIIILLALGIIGLIITLVGWMLLTGLNMATLTSINIGWAESYGAGLAVLALNMFNITRHFAKDEEGNK
jgi:hypothetical protein